MNWVFKIVLALCPVFAFLAALVVLDSFKLVRQKLIILALIAGAATALLCYYLNGALAEQLTLAPMLYSRYVAPVIEELLKAIFLILLFRTRRIGFTVDAAIYGFAIGAGFGVAENIYYLKMIGDASPLTWVVRGFGTAAMHGGTVCLFGIISQTTSDRWSKAGWAAFLPGLLTAIVVHSAFNHFVLPPIISTVLLLVIFPVIIGIAFKQSERVTQQWLGTGLDLDMELLDLITSGRISDSHIGTYLDNLRHRFPFEVVVDLLCYLRIHLELALQAKGLLMMRQAGLPIPVDPELRERFTELWHLERSIGKTGKLAIQPFLRSSRRDLWQIYLLSRSGGDTPAAK
jgi:RsiW-degrading membrane proteinase PrsW (M82 family)